MSNIYIQEPPTYGKVFSAGWHNHIKTSLILRFLAIYLYLSRFKVLLKTSVGEIDIELWAKETPKACRNFVQLCLEGYYNGTIFHRIVKGFIAQGGDPTGTGTGERKLYGCKITDWLFNFFKIYVCDFLNL